MNQQAIIYLERGVFNDIYFVAEIGVERMQQEVSRIGKFLWDSSVNRPDVLLPLTVVP